MADGGEVWLTVIKELGSEQQNKCRSRILCT